MSLTLLGPERPDGVLPELLVKHGVTGPVGLISAGWRYDEARDEPLRAAIPNEVKNLRLYERFRSLERDAAELMSRYTAKQDLLRRIKDRYRMRVQAGLDSAYALLREFRTPTDKWFLHAVQQLRETDDLFLSEARVLHEMFEQQARPGDHPLVRREREGVRADLDGCAALLIAGGHIGVLRNRCVFLDVGPVLTQRPLYAWSAGAMLLTERVLLYHDHTAYGPGTAEFLDHGLGLLRETVLLPHARERLNLTDTIHLSVLAHRLLPRKAVCLQNGAIYEDGVYTGKPGAAFILTLDGSQHAERT
ncbi:MAG: hypothetical protein EXR71_00990 [Myxococcales bacterium]|nr:hypothetical protein [Myxococcales bacterium]